MIDHLASDLTLGGIAVVFGGVVTMFKIDVLRDGYRKTFRTERLPHETRKINSAGRQSELKEAANMAAAILSEARTDLESWQLTDDALATLMSCDAGVLSPEQLLLKKALSAIGIAQLRIESLNPALSSFTPESIVDAARYAKSEADAATRSLAVAELPFSDPGSQTEPPTKLEQRRKQSSAMSSMTIAQAIDLTEWALDASRSGYELLSRELNPDGLYEGLALYEAQSAIVWFEQAVKDGATGRGVKRRRRRTRSVQPVEGLSDHEGMYTRAVAGSINKIAGAQKNRRNKALADASVSARRLIASASDCLEYCEFSLNSAENQLLTDDTLLVEAKAKVAAARALLASAEQSLEYLEADLTTIPAENVVTAANAAKVAGAEAEHYCAKVSLATHELDPKAFANRATLSSNYQSDQITDLVSTLPGFNSQSGFAAALRFAKAAQELLESLPSSEAVKPMALTLSIGIRSLERSQEGLLAARTCPSI